MNIGHERAGRAFSLIELLVVVAIIGVLAGLLLPAIAIVRDLSRATVCANHLRQLGLGMVAYSEDNDGCLPPVYVPPGYAHPVDSWYWWMELIPYLSRSDDTNYSAANRFETMGYRNVLRGCPLRRENFSGADWHVGYGMNGTLGRLGSDPTSTSTSSNRNNAVWRDWRLSQVNLRSTRVLLMDAQYSELRPQATIGTYQAGFGEPLRHRGRANYLMIDGHIASLLPRDGWFGITDPRQVHP